MLNRPHLRRLKSHFYRNEGFNKVQSVIRELQANQSLSLPGLLIDERSPSARHGLGYADNKDGNKTDDTAYVFDGSGENFTVDQYAARLKREAKLYRDEPDVELKDVLVSIRADAEVKTGDVQKIVQYAQEAEFEKFAMKATQETTP